MAEKEIKIGFPETKMEALEFFLRENDTTVEKVLKEHLDKTYEKSVPQPLVLAAHQNLPVPEHSPLQYSVWYRVFPVLLSVSGWNPHSDRHLLPKQSSYSPQIF